MEILLLFFYRFEICNADVYLYTNGHSLSMATGSLYP